MTKRAELRLGVLYALLAYISWGFAPIYFKAIAHVPPFEVLAHRVLWSVLMLLVWAALRQRLGAIRHALCDRRTVLTLCLTALLVTVNWFIFIWAIFTDHVLDASLGYYINPLVNVLLGFVFLGERLRRLQRLSVVLATAGVVYLSITLGKPPYISLALAFTFGFYGLLRKTARVDGVIGLTLETLFLSPVAIIYLVWLRARGEMLFGTGDISTDLLLVAAGLVTAVPLLWFTNAARRLRYATLGFIQYLAPSTHFILAVVVYQEPLDRNLVITFGCIWTALALYTVDTVRQTRAS